MQYALPERPLTSIEFRNLEQAPHIRTVQQLDLIEEVGPFPCLITSFECATDAGTYTLRWTSERDCWELKEKVDRDGTGRRSQHVFNFG